MQSTEHVQRGALAVAMQRAGLSQTELARRAAPGMGVSVASLGPILSRLLSGERASTRGVPALERALGVSDGDLRAPASYVFLRGGRPASIGTALVIFSEPDRAYAARADAPETFAGATLGAVLASRLEEAVSSTFGELSDEERAVAVRLDPSAAELRQLAVLHAAVAGSDPARRQGAAQALADAHEAGLLALDLDAIYRLAERRLDAPGAPLEQLEAWTRENTHLLGVKREIVRRAAGVGR